MGLKLHTTLQVSALPDISFVVHALPSSQDFADGMDRILQDMRFPEGLRRHRDSSP